jgi:hypothetical protein
LSLAEAMAKAAFEKMSERVRFPCSWEDESQELRDDWIASMKATFPLISKYLGAIEGL